MTTHKIQSLRSLREEMKAVARGERPAPPDAARMSFDSVEALARRPRARSSEPGRHAMARHQTRKRSLTWGDTVTVSEGVPARFRQGELGAVCGVRAIETTAAAGAPPLSPEAALRGLAQEVAEAAARRARERGVADVETVVKRGPPSRTIVDYAEERGANAIVLGSRGLGDIGGFLLGSVSHKVASLAKCTCITVR